MTPTPPIWIEAHRGDSANAPENTLAAFRRAIDIGAPSFELDVHPAKDGTLVVMHDDTVDRTTDGSGAICDMAIDALRRLDAGSWFGPQFAGERIPLLEEVLRLLAPVPTLLNVEVKASPPGLDVPQTLVALLRRFGKERDYIVSSFDLDVVLRVQAIAPEITLALIGEGPQILPLAQQHGLSWIHCHRTTLDEQVIAAAHASSIRVNVWTVDDPDELRHWQGLGVDKLCTNRPAVMLAAARG